MNCKKCSQNIEYKNIENHLCFLKEKNEILKKSLKKLEKSARKDA